MTGPEDVLHGWQAALAMTATPESLLLGTEGAHTWLDLTHAHPSGLAQLMAGRPTRLSSLVREPGAHQRARRRARTIRGIAVELAAERGIRSGYLAAGIATWRPGPLRVLDLDASTSPVSAPVLLRGCTLVPRGAGHEDYDLELDDMAFVNPELLRRLATDYRVRPNGDALVELAFGRDGFDPHPVFTRLEELCAAVPAFRVERCLVVGTFTAGSRALLADLEDAGPALVAHPLLGRLLLAQAAADRAARRAVEQEKAGATTADPSAETASGTADATDQPTGQVSTATAEGQQPAGHDTSGSALTETAPTETAPTETAPTETAPTETTAGPDPSGASSDPAPGDRGAAAESTGTARAPHQDPPAVHRMSRVPHQDPPAVHRAAVSGAGDRDPAAESLVLDLDPAQHAALDAVLAGEHAVLDGPPGSGTTHTLIAITAALAAQGRSVLVVASRRATADAFVARLGAAGLADLVLDLQDGIGHPGRTRAGLGISLESITSGDALVRAGATESRSWEITQELRAVRDRLASSSSALHELRIPWQVSAYEAMAQLVALMALPCPPRTRVRLSRPVLERMDVQERERLSQELSQAAGVGAFRLTRADTRWVDVTVRSDEEAERVLAATTRARDLLGRARREMDVVATSSGLVQSTTVRGWRPQLDLLVGIRDVLDFLLPEVYRRPLDDLIAVTSPAGTEVPDPRQPAPSPDGPSAADRSAADRSAATGDGAPAGSASEEGWSPGDTSDRGTQDPPGSSADPTPEGSPTLESLGWLARRRLRRVARTLVRPGVHVSDLNRMLLTARGQREAWREMAVDDRLPQVPTGLADAGAAVGAVESALAVLAGVLYRPDLPDLLDLPLGELESLLADLSTDVAGVRRQPQRIVLTERLRAAGLGALVDDLRDRRAGAEDVEGELELAWWASVLEAIVRDDPRLAPKTGAGVQADVSEFCRLDLAHLADGASRVRARWARYCDRISREHPDQVRWLRAEVAHAHRSVWPMDLLRRARDLVTALRPVWVMSPDAVARLLPPTLPNESFVDVVIVDDASHVPLPEVAAALVRGSQIVVAGDLRGIPPVDGDTSVLEAVATVAEVHRLDQDHRTADGRLLTPVRSCYPEGWLLTPGADAVPQLRLETVPHGIGLPDPGLGVVVTSNAEVQRVVDLVERHALRHPGESLMVVTLEQVHAERIEEALRAQGPLRPALATWLENRWAGTERRQPMLVQSADHVLGVERDHVIVSVGLARTGIGDVPRAHGVLDGPAGAAVLRTALTRARRRLTLVSCLGIADLDPQYGDGQGVRLLREVLTVVSTAATIRGMEPGASGRSIAGSVGPAVGTQPDPLLVDLRERLQARGLRVADRFGDPDWPLDLAVRDPRGGRMLVAVDLDGPAHAGRRGVRERDRQRRQRWERAGWVYCRVGSMDLFRDPEAEVERIRACCQDGVTTAGDRDVIDLTDEGVIDVAGTADEPARPDVRTVDLGAVPGEPEPVPAGHGEKGRSGGQPVNSGRGRPGRTGPEQGGQEEPVLPEQTRDDTDRGWGEDAPEDDDERLLRERPPHWE